MNPFIANRRRIIQGWMVACAMITSTNLYGQATTDYVVEGFSQPFKVSKVAAATMGVVKEQLAQPGTVVEEGSVLVKLEADVQEKLVEFHSLNSQSKSDVVTSEAEVKAARTKLEQGQGLRNTGHLTASELLRYQLEFELAQTRLQATIEKSQLRQLEYQKVLAEARQTEIRAPFTGTIVEYFKQKGEFVGPSDPFLCKLVDLRTLSVEFLVPSHLGDQITVGAKVPVVFLKSGEKVEGQIYYVSPYPNGESDTYQMKVKIDNSHSRLRAGQHCQINMSDLSTKKTAVKADWPIL